MRRPNRVIAGLLAALAAMPAAAQEKGAAPGDPDRAGHLDTVCTLIRDSADRHGLPRDFLARLIWKESRFDADAVSPAGAEGIAQFMPSTAKLRGLADSFDMAQAIPASAAYLAEMKAAYGNLGRAAIGYNAGEGRLNRWIANGGFLPLETEDYVLSILGEAADSYADAAHQPAIRPLDETLDFDAACRKLPVIAAATIPMARVHTLPWGVQVAGNFRRSAAIRQWQRLKRRFPSLLADHEPVVSRVRSPLGRRGIHAVRIGVDKRANADIICQQLRAAGGSCVVMRNR